MSQPTDLAVAVAQDLAPLVGDVQTEIELLEQQLSPTQALDSVTLEVVERIKPKLKGATLDQLIRTLGYLSSMYRKGGDVNVHGPAQFNFNGPAPR